MIGVIDVGGGVRGAFGAGVLDYCMMNGIRFDYGIGVSAGSANIASYMAGQTGRNYIFYTDYFERWQYMSLRSMLQTGSYIGLEYIYGDLSNTDGEYALDWQAIMDGGRPYWTVCTNALTGKAEYFDQSDMSENHYSALKASCCVPVIDRPYMMSDVPYYDGGISDPVPYRKAFADGCDKVVLILTRPKDFRRIPKKDKVFADILKVQYPAAAQSMASRSLVYNQCVDEAVELEKQGKLLIIAPDTIGHMKTLTKDKASISDLYLQGFRKAKQIVGFVR